jgi:PAS domain S-box-containing protein
MAPIDPANRHLSYLRSVLDCTNDPLFVTEQGPKDRAGPRICFVNQAFTRLTGYALTEVAGRPPTFLCAPCNNPQVIDQVGAAFERSERASFLLLNARKDGSRYRTELLINPLLDNDGYDHVVAIQRVQIEGFAGEQDNESGERRFQLLADNLTEAVLIYRDKQPLFANRAYVELFGYVSMAEALREISPLMNLPLAQTKAAEAASMRRQPIFCEALRTDGAPLRLVMRSHAIDWRGGTATMLSITQDKRRTAPPRPLAPAGQKGLGAAGEAPPTPEEALLLQELMDSVPIILAHKTRDLRYLYVNQTYADWVGLPRDQIIGRHVCEVRNEAHFQLMKGRRAEVLSGRIVQYNTKCEFPGRGMCDLLTTLMPQRNASGEVESYFSLVEDITDLKEVERALLRREQQLQLVMDSVPALITYRDRNLRYQYVNRQYHEWFGVRREEMIGHHTADFLDLELFRRLKPYIDRVLAGEHVTHSQVANFPGVGWRKVHISFIPHVDENGHVVGFFSLGQEITLTAEESVPAKPSGQQAISALAVMRVTSK